MKGVQYSIQDYYSLVRKRNSIVIVSLSSSRRKSYKACVSVFR